VIRKPMKILVLDGRMLRQPQLLSQRDLSAGRDQPVTPWTKVACFQAKLTVSRFVS
jgi:hypothetical protein